jgi:putative DNA-invertase from lambdoid prophage Rac
MSRIFAYVRVSTFEQETQNQVMEIEAAGFNVAPHRIITETVSGSRAIAQRAGFGRLMEKMEQGDVLIVTKLDRLGRDAIDVSSTVASLEEQGVRVHCLALGGVDLTSSAGKLTMGVINAVAQFERDLLIERTQAGLARAKLEGKALGRPPALSGERQEHVRQRLANGESVSAVARDTKTSRQTIMRTRDFSG